MEMGGNFCQILELGGTTIKGRRVAIIGGIESNRIQQIRRTLMKASLFLLTRNVRRAFFFTIWVRSANIFQVFRTRGRKRAVILEKK